MNSVFYIPVNSRLQEYITMIWEVNRKKNSSEIILLKGIIEIVFNFTDRMNGVMPGGEIVGRVPRCFIQGIHTHIIHSDYTGQHHLLDIRLHPFSIKPLFGVLPSELNNTIIDLTLMAHGYDRLWHQLVELNSFDEKVKLLEKELPFLSGQVCSRSHMLSNLFLSATPEHFQSVNALA